MSEMNHGANGLAFVHQVKRFVDALKRHGVRNEGIQVNFIIHETVDVTWQFSAPFDATECTAAPHAASDQLKRTC